MEDVQTVTIPFTQYLLPNGRRDRVEVELPDPDGTLASAVETIHGRGLVFECEMLRDYKTVSFTTTLPDAGDVYCKLCPNGPDVPPLVEQLIRETAAAIADGSIEAHIAELEE